MIRYPNIIGKSEAQQLEQIKSYLHQLADELNFRLEQNAGASAASATVMAGASSKPTKTEEAISNFNEIKGLIIKSADIVDSYSEQISDTLRGEFVAVSDFGTYTEDTLTELGISSQDIQATITKVEAIDGEIKNAVQSEVKQTAESITLSVENGETTAQIKLQIGGEEKTGEIAMTGVVSFSNLTDGTTEISGENIKTGTIKAESIDTTDLVVNKLYALDGAGSGLTVDKYGIKRESADGETPIVDLKHDWFQTGGVLEEKPYFDLFGTHFDRDVIPGELSNKKIAGIHIDADNIQFRSNIGNFTDYPIHSYDHTVDFGIARSGQVTGKLKVDAPTEDTHVVNKQYVDSHVSDKNNPHGVTAAQVGAAPAGYGLGANTGKIVTDANEAKLNGFYAMSGADAVNCGENIYRNFMYGTLFVEVRYTNTIHQTVSYADRKATRYTTDGGTNWSEWVESATQAVIPVNRGGTGATGASAARANLEINPTNIGAIAQASNYYSSGKSADDLGASDSLALIPCNATTNPELYAIIKTGFAYVMTVYYSSIKQRAQIAISYAANPPKMAIRTLYGGTWTPWTEMSNGILYGLDTGAITIASGTTKEYSDSKSKMYNVTVQIGSTAYRHTFVVDRSAVNNATNKQIGYYSDAMGNQMNLVVSIKDSTTVTFKPTGCNIVHISGYY